MSTQTPSHPPLTDRQKRILRMIGLGMNRKEIARELGMSKTAIYQSTYTISERIGVSSDHRLALYAIKHGYVRIDEVDIP